MGDRVTFRFSSLKPSWRMDFAIAKYGELTSGVARVYYLPGDSAGAEGVAGAARNSLDLCMNHTRLLDDWLFTTGRTGRVEESPKIAALEAYYRRGAQADRK